MARWGFRWPIERKTTDASNLTWSKLLGTAAAKAGVSVNNDTAIRVTTAFSCARVLAEGIAQLPLKIYRLGENDSLSPAKDHPAYKLLWRRPNDWMTSFELREMMMYHAVFNGNAYAFLGRGGVNRRIVEILPLVGRTKVRQNNDWSLTYDVTLPGGQMETFPREDILHLRGPTWNGYCGLDVVQVAREAIALAIATEESHSMLHANGVRSGGILEIKPGNIDPERRKKLIEEIQRTAAGLKNVAKTFVVDIGMEWTPMDTMKGVDAQHLETRRFQIEEICRAMRVFPQMVGHTDKTATFASAEAFFIAHVIHSLMPWSTRWEQVLERDILDNADDHAIKLTLQALLRGDATSRANYFKAALGAGGSPAWMTQDEVRRLEELNPFGGSASQLPVPTNAPPAAAAANDPTQSGEDAAAS